MGIARKQIRWNGWGWTAHHDTLAGQDTTWRWLAGALGMPALLATPSRALEDITLPSTTLTAQQMAGFIAILGADRVMTDDHERAFHARGRAYHDLLHLRAGDLASAPDAVLYPRGEDEVLAILQLAAREKIAVVPFGGGTATAGGVTGHPGGVTIDLSGMDRVLDIDTQSGIATVEAGITGAALEKALSAKGLMLGNMPGHCEFSTIGGHIAATSAGQGRGTDWLVSARLATPQGILDTALSAGPDLKHLLPASQGAFGIITQTRLRLRPLVTPMDRSFLFRDFSGGGAAIREALRADIPHLSLRLCDAEETRLWRAFAELETPRGLLDRVIDAWRAVRHFEAGTATLLTAAFPDTTSARRFEVLAKKQGAMMVGKASAKEQPYLTPYRRDALLDRGVGLDVIETFVSWSALPGLQTATCAALEQAMRDNAPRPGAHGLVMSHIADVAGDGARITFTTLFPRQLDSEIAQWQAIRCAASSVIASHGGSASEGNLQVEKDALAPAMLRAIKATLDPGDILNPGKLLPPL